MSFGKVISGILVTLVVVGVLKGLGDVESFTGDNIGDILLSIINGISDLTIKLVPTIIDTASKLLDQIL
ncbi:hypothetical protein [Corynebacterium crudilactis]|uniref:Uncharacterized protein n=1 Tax=Corynebacterium crudilactis TaxID=1652495 RepID=A0A172QXU0_9CORY|nr:hypothetical protein [Corynebacterium crudilactis]ANE05461.1 hypothetical protein ccrud_14060 [Corynebacterium crudilactis]